MSVVQVLLVVLGIGLPTLGMLAKSWIRRNSEPLVAMSAEERHEREMWEIEEHNRREMAKVPRRVELPPTSVLREHVLIDFDRVYEEAVAGR